MSERDLPNAPARTSGPSQTSVDEEPMNVGIAGLSHETHTFLPDRTTIDPFERDAVRGSEMIDRFRGTNSVVGGFIDTCERSAVAVDIIPAVHARGGVSGTVEESVFRQYVDEIGSEFAGAELDGVLLFLHGAMVTTQRTGPESDVVETVRETVGDAVPIVVGMDLHGNVGEELIGSATAVCSYLNSPHVDQHETGCRAARLLLSTVGGDVVPTMRFAKPGVVVPSVFSATTVPPAKDVVTRAVTWRTNPEFHDVTRWESKSAVLDVSMFFGFAWADVPQVGATAVAVTDNDPELAEEIVRDLAEFTWERREQLTEPTDLYSVEDGVRRAIGLGRDASAPVLVLDHADRLAETTYVLRELLARDAPSAAVPLLFDPEAVETCRSVGEGNRVRLPVGSKRSERGGGPVELDGEVEYVGSITYTANGPMKRGEEVTQGATAIVRDGGVWVQLTSDMDGGGLTSTDPIEKYGYDPGSFDVIVSKSKTHFRAVFEEFASEIVIVDAPEYSPADLSHYDFERVPDGVYPITTPDRNDT